MTLVNQVAEFSLDISKPSQLLRPLMSPKRTFTRTTNHGEAFNKVMEAFSRPHLYTAFHLALPTTQQPDALQLHGLGYALL